MRLLKNESRKAAAGQQTFSGKWYPGMPDFTDWEEEMEWIDQYEEAHGIGGGSDLDAAIGEIAKYLVGSSPSESNLLAKARMVAEGVMTAKEAADQLSNKKVIVKRGAR